MAAGLEVNIQELTGLATPPFTASSPNNEQTPAPPAGSFSYRTRCLDSNSLGLATPVDKETGLPLPIMLTEPLHGSANTSFVDYHHHFHPEREHTTGGGKALIALRRSRGQLLPRWLHEHYHHYFAGPELPRKQSQIFRSTVLACAGVVPRQALDFGAGNTGPKIVVPSNDAYEIIGNSVRTEAERLTKGSMELATRSGNFSRAQIGMFFANYAIRQSFDRVVSSKVLDEFVHTKSPVRRLALGNLIIKAAIQISIEPIEPVHRRMQREGLINRKPTDLESIVRDYFVRNRQSEYFRAIDRKLLYTTKAA